MYRLAIPMASRVLIVSSLVGLSLLAAGGLIFTLATDGPRTHLPWFLLMCAALAWNWYVLLNIPYEIRFETTDRLSFVALRGVTSLSAAQLHSLKPYRGGGGFYVLRHEGGRIRLISQITGFHEVITRIKAANPNFEVVGI